MNELIQFFIEQASIDEAHLGWLVFAAMVILAGIFIFTGYIFSEILKFLKSFKPIQINKINKVDKIVEVPKYVDNLSEIKEILKKVNEIEQDQKENIKL